MYLHYPFILTVSLFQFYTFTFYTVCGLYKHKCKQSNKKRAGKRETDQLTVVPMPQPGTMHPLGGYCQLYFFSVLQEKKSVGLQTAL